MKQRWMIGTIVLALGMTASLAGAEMDGSRVPPKGTEGPDIHARVEPKGVEGPDVRRAPSPTVPQGEVLVPR